MKWSALVLILATVACGPGNRQSPGDDDGSNGGGDGGNGSSGSNSDGCSDDAKLIYVVDQNNKLAQFNPMTKTFTTLGTINCNPGTDPLTLMPYQPFSMAVDRTAQAYVLFSNDKIYKVDTTQSSLPCTATSWVMQDNLQEFGMGYSTDTAGGTTDTLFIAGGANLTTGVGPTSSKLATVNTSSFTATSVGTVAGWPELTGNSNAELWGWFPDVSGSVTPFVEQLDKTSGAGIPANTYKEPTLDDGMEPIAWAFGFYGGDYWVFLQLQSDFPPQSKVYEIAGPANTTNTPGSIVTTTPAPSLTIVGAGVSTCAPTVIQ